jgi:hypothetical protein
VVIAAQEVTMGQAFSGGALAFDAVDAYRETCQSLHGLLMNS